MSKHTRFTIRCTQSERVELEERAEGNVAGYVRRLLFDEQGAALSNIERRLDELIESVRVIEQTGARKGEEMREAGPSTEVSPATQGMILELLLLMRGATNRTNLQAAQAEVERQGFPVFEDRGQNKR
jgi:hypothetical protein